MKTHFLHYLTFLIIVGCLLNCTSKEENPQPTRPATLEEVVPASLLDSLRRKGMAINTGQLPPQVAGIFTMSPVIVTANTGPSDALTIGLKIADYRFQFLEQDSQANTLKIRYKSIPSADQADGSIAFITGANNRFSVFAENKGTDQGISYVSITVVSGEMTSAGIRNMQLAYLIKSKNNDPNGKLFRVGQPRVFRDGDGLSLIGNAY